MLWSQTVGHNKERKLVIQQIRQGVLAHAILLVGPEGVGKLAFALSMAQYIFCENQLDDDSCGNCKGCRKVSKLIHPDLHYTYPVHSTGSRSLSSDFITEWRSFILQTPFGSVSDWYRHLADDNKQGNISKDECQRIINEIGLMAYEGGKKVWIIWQAELLAKEGNRLLKLLEEPPSNTHFILVAADPDQLLNTIVSRCQVLRLAQLSVDEVKQCLLNESDIAADKAEQIAYVCNGKLDLAFRLLHSDEIPDADTLVNWFRILYRGNGLEVKAWVDQLTQKSREDQKRMLYYALDFLREILHGLIIPDYGPKLLQRQFKSFSGLLKVLNIESTKEMIKLVDDALAHLERNANSKILFMHLSIRMHQIFQIAEKMDK